jgi:hypothetical protein
MIVAFIVVFIIIILTCLCMALATPPDVKRFIPPASHTPQVTPTPDAFPLHYQSPYLPPQHPPQVIALPISPYTGQEYDPAWFSEMGGGQSNRATLALMKHIEREIDGRKGGVPKDEPEYEQVQAPYPESEQ